MLSTAWFRAAASDCPSWATSINRVCSAGIITVLTRPKTRTATKAPTGVTTRKLKTASIAASASMPM